MYPLAPCTGLEVGVESGRYAVTLGLTLGFESSYAPGGMAHQRGLGSSGAGSPDQDRVLSIRAQGDGPLSPRWYGPDIQGTLPASHFQVIPDSCVSRKLGDKYTGNIGGKSSRKIYIF